MAERNDNALSKKTGLFKTASLEDPNYDPGKLLNAVIEKLGLKNDAALSRVLEVEPPMISKVRNKKLPVGAVLLIRMHEVSDLSIRDLRLSMFKQ